MAADNSPSQKGGALAGLRVLELGQLIAGPFATSVLASFGADVVKIEEPTRGDPIRKWRMLHDGTSLWWRTLARNKRSVALDLRSAEGQDIVRRFVSEAKVDVIVENFRPGRLEQWGLGYEELSALNERLIMVRVSGWGQDGPRAKEPGFANIAEAFGGLRFLSGEPGRPPVRAGVSIGDSLAGLHAALGLMMAIHHRDVVGSGKGQVVDVALYESVFHMLESTLPEFDMFGKVRQRSGAAMPGIVPTNTYPCLEGRWIAIGANSDAMYRRLMKAIGRVDLALDPALAENDGRVRQSTRIDAAIVAFTETRSVAQVLLALREAEVAVGAINSIAEIAQDEHYQARQMFERHTLPSGDSLRIPAARPKLSMTPAQTRWLGPELGEHTREVVADWLGLPGDEEE